MIEKILGKNKIIADKAIEYYGVINRRLPKFLRWKPLYYLLFITNKCNLNCVYCWQKVDEKDKDIGVFHGSELLPEEWIKFINNLSFPSVLVFTGGEPLLYDGFKQIIGNIPSRNFVSINTNGIALNEDYSKQFVDKNIHNISISLDGFQDISTRGRKEDFNKIVHNINVLNEVKKLKRKKKPLLTIKTSITDDVVDQLEAFCEFCDNELNANTIVIQLVKTLHHAQFSFRVYKKLSDLMTAGTPMSYKYQRSKEIVDSLCHLIKKYSSRRMSIEIFPKLKTKEQFQRYFDQQGIDVYKKCNMPWSMITVLPSGDVVPCFSLSLGNIKEFNYNINTTVFKKRHEGFYRDFGIDQSGDHTPPYCNCCCYLVGR